MRVISGEKRGVKMLTLEGLDVRPTTDRVKESLFNILQFSIAGRHFLDMFAGSGQMGIEALSRGAKNATFVDASPKSIEVCKKNLSNVNYFDKAKVVNAQSQTYIKNTPDKYDVAFLDPPYHIGILEESLLLVAEKMNLGGTIVCEHPADMILIERAGCFTKTKVHKYGKISLSIYKCIEDKE